MIYVLVSAHNEAATVGLLLWKVRQVFSAFGREYHLIVVDDASNDGTAEVLAPYARALPMTLVTHRERRGYGACQEELLRLAVERSDRPRRDIAVTLQADLSDSADEIPELVRRMEGGADVAVADSRTRAGSSRVESLARRLLTPLARRATGVSGVDDFVSTLRAYRLAPVARMLRERPPAASDRPHDVWEASLALLVRIARHARRIETVPAAAARAARQRPSKRHALRSLFRAWRAASALSGLLDAPLPPAEPERPPDTRDTDSPRGRGRRGRRRGAGGRGGRGERGVRGRRGDAGGSPQGPAPSPA